MAGFPAEKSQHMKAAAPKLVFGLLISLAYTLGTMAHLRAVARVDVNRPDEGAFKKLLGDGRRLFAGQFVEMADVYFHSGFYPSIFDRAGTAKSAKAVTSVVNQDVDLDHEGHKHDEHGNCVSSESHEGHKHDEHGNCDHAADDEHVKSMTPAATQNWLEAFIRRFRITEHSHLAEGDEREILPWLKLAIELDPQAIETYTTTAFWLRKTLNKTDAAEALLREGIRNNPTNAEILFEMGSLYKENHHDSTRARNIWLLALKMWEAQSAVAKEAGLKLQGRILANLAKLESEAGHWQKAIKYFELAKAASPKPEAIQKQVDEILAEHPAATNPAPALVPAP